MTDAQSERVQQFIRVEDWEHEASTDTTPGEVFEITLTDGTYSNEKFDSLYRLVGDLISNAGFNMGYDRQPRTNTVDV